jgi:hypothetical protein
MKCPVSCTKWAITEAPDGRFVGCPHLPFLARLYTDEESYARLIAAAPELVAELILIHQQVTNGRLCYFGDHTGYTPQIGSEQTDRWKALIAKATGGNS